MSEELTLFADVIYGMSNEAYHRGPGLSCSQVKRLKRTPLHMHALTLPRDVPESAPSPAMFNGTLVHCALLERPKFDARYVVGPEVNKLTKEWKAFKAQCLEQGLTPIDADQRRIAFAQADSLRALPEVAELMTLGDAEVSAFWEDTDHQGPPVLCKCRPDWVGYVEHRKGAILMDVKTAVDASPEGFSKACASFGYHMQASWYTNGFERASGLHVHGMVFVVVEPEYPHAAACYMLSDEALRKGADECRQALTLYRQCRATGQWPGYPPGITVLSLPHWYGRNS